MNWDNDGFDEFGFNDGHQRGEGMPGSNWLKEIEMQDQLQQNKKKQAILAERELLNNKSVDILNRMDLLLNQMNQVVDVEELDKLYVKGQGIYQERLAIIYPYHIFFKKHPELNENGYNAIDDGLFVRQKIKLFDEMYEKHRKILSSARKGKRHAK